MALNKFSDLEENILTKDFLIEFKKMGIDHIDDLYTYEKTFKKSMKEFKFSIRMMFIFSFLGLFVFVLPGLILSFFAFRLNNRANSSKKALALAIEEYKSELENNKP